MTRLARPGAAMVLVLGIVACGPEGPTKQQMGALGGGALGALAGAQIGEGTGQLAATAAGTLLGAWVGSELGRRMDDRSRVQAAQAEERALASNTSTTWVNPDAGTRGTVTPVRTYEADGRFCREYVHTVYIEGRAEEARGTACRQADGSWRLVS